MGNELKAVLVVSMLVLSGCGVEREPWENPTPTSEELWPTGAWENNAACTGGLTGYFFSGYGFNLTASLGTIPTGCRGDTAATCAYGGTAQNPGLPRLACTVNIASAGAAILVGRNPERGMYVFPGVTP